MVAPARETAAVDDVRHAVYLRPGPPLEAAVAAVHRRMATRWGLAAAGRFMPHVTLKGFFRTEATPSGLEDRVAAALAGHAPVALHQAGVTAFATDAVVLDVDGDGAGARNAALHALHVAVLDATAPLVIPDRFEAEEYVRDAFRAHVTLAMADIPAARFAAVLADARSLEPIGPRVSTAAAVQVAVFESADWSGRWWETMTWHVVAELPLAGPVSQA
jgi:2'-5' RNA ligase